MHVVSKHSIDGGLISLAMPTKKTKYIGVKTQRDLLLLAWPTNGVIEKFGPSSGLSDKSISESRSASTRFQLVRDRFFVPFAFTTGCLS
jgi:hypothetical protein